MSAAHAPVQSGRPEHEDRPDGKGLTLVLNAAEGLLQIGLADADGRLLFASSQDAPSRGVEILIPSLDSALRMLERQIADIARIAVVRGPGSFTGLRLTAVTAAALARSVAARQAGLDYMHCLARQVCRDTSSDGKLRQNLLCEDAPKTQLWVLVRARRDLVYVQGFARPGEQDGEGGPFRPLTDLAVMTVASGEAAGHIVQTAALHGAARVLLAGSGAKENRECIAPALAASASLRAALLDVTTPWPDTLLAAARDATYEDADIEPLYVRVSDAEANLPHIADRLGQDPGEAVRLLHALTHTNPDKEA